MSPRRSWGLLLVGVLAAACNERYTIGAEQPASSSGDGTSQGPTSTGAGTGTTTHATTEAGTGSAGTGSSTDSGSGTGSSGASLCTAEVGTTPCETCLRSACCDPLLACVDLDSCRCVLACRIEGHSLQSCETDCGGGMPASTVLHECSFDGCEACF